jgi:CheY-like chemotaxis protein
MTSNNSLRILVVDDDPLASEIVHSVLQSQGHIADIASDGFEALQLLHAQPYALVLIDYHLPEMDGYALAKLVRNSGERQPAPMRLVGITADRHGLAARRGVDRVFDAILTKPFPPAALLEQVTLATMSTPESADAAMAFLAHPVLDRARMAARTFWQARGLPHLPRVAIYPAPSDQQTSDYRACFDVVDVASADLLLLLDVRGLQQMLVEQMADGARTLPAITIDPALKPVCQMCFDIADRDSWSMVAGLLTRKAS